MSYTKHDISVEQRVTRYSIGYERKVEVQRILQKKEQKIVKVMPIRDRIVCKN